MLRVPLSTGAALRCNGLFRYFLVPVGAAHGSVGTLNPGLHPGLQSCRPYRAKGGAAGCGGHHPKSWAMRDPASGSRKPETSAGIYSFPGFMARKDAKTQLGKPLRDFPGLFKLTGCWLRPLPRPSRSGIFFTPLLLPCQPYGIQTVMPGIRQIDPVVRIGRYIEEEDGTRYLLERRYFKGSTIFFMGLCDQ